MGHRLDAIERFRRWFVPKLGLVSHAIEELTGKRYYECSETHTNQFVGRVEMEVEQFEEFLHEHGFHRNPLASLKRHVESDEIEEGSWRTVGFDGAPRKQLHVILYDGNELRNPQSDCTYVYSHWEYRWDTDPLKHLRGVDVNAGIGVRRMKAMLDESGVAYEPIRP